METIKIKSSLVVMAMDDFTGKAIENQNVRVWIDGERPCVVKQGGYRVFTNLKEEDFVLKIIGGQYLYQEILFPREKLLQYAGRVFKIRMLPNRCYPIPSDTTIAEGMGKPHTEYIAYCREAFSPYKLLYAYEKGMDEISIFHPAHVDIEGKSLFIGTKDSEEIEFFMVEGKREGEAPAYLLEKPLSKAYKKIGTMIYPSYRILTDEQGKFYLPVIGTKKEAMKFSFFHPESGKTQEEVLLAGRINQVMLDMETSRK